MSYPQAATEVHEGAHVVEYGAPKKKQLPPGREISWEVANARS